ELHPEGRHRLPDLAHAQLEQRGHRPRRLAGLQGGHDLQVHRGSVLVRAPGDDRIGQAAPSPVDGGATAGTAVIAMDSAMRVRLLRRHSRRASKPGIRFADSVDRLMIRSADCLSHSELTVPAVIQRCNRKQPDRPRRPWPGAGRHRKVSRTRKTSMRESPDSPGPPIHAARSTEDRQFVTALARGLEVLRCFSAETPELGSREIARRIGLSQSTVWRLCHTLSQLGYVVPGTAPGKLRVGAPTLALGAASLDALRYTEIIEPHLRAFVSRYPAAAVLAQQHEMTMIYLIRCNGETSFVMNHPVGTSVPLADTMFGCTCLAGMP